MSAVCATGQHRQMLDQVLTLFEIEPDIDLNLMQSNQTLSGLAARIHTAIDDVIVAERPDVVLIQGDTTTVAAVAMAAFHRHVLVGHVEGGLRSGDMQSPFPEEMNRRRLQSAHDPALCAHRTCPSGSLAERIADDHVFVTGNSVIDALHQVLSPTYAAICE